MSDIDMEEEEAAAEMFEILLLDMGQGDSILIRCPDNRVVMIDCGSSSGLASNAELLYRNQASVRSWTSQNGNKIDALILTHPDGDHYNQVSRLLNSFKWSEDVEIDGNRIAKPSFPAVIIPEIYVSTRGDSQIMGGPLQLYKENKTNVAVYENNFRTEVIYEVTINSTHSSYRTWMDDDYFKAPSAPKSIPAKRLIILKGITPNDRTWSVSIIAGMVEVNKNLKLKGDNGAVLVDAAKPSNVASLVTLLEINEPDDLVSYRALFTGDATFSTEAFLLDTHEALIKNIAVAQTPHHGSETSSSPLFVQTLNPLRTVTSVGRMEIAYHLPRKVVLERWLKVMGRNLAVGKANHQVDYWEQDTLAGANAQLGSWQSAGVSIKTSAAGGGKRTVLWYLTAPFANGSYAISSDLILYRDTKQLPLLQTATRGAIRLELPPS